MFTVEMYIGENNETHTLEQGKIEEILSRYHTGFTMHEAVGHWQGQQENTAVVTVADEQDKIMQTINRLKEELAQEAIAWREVPALNFA